MTMGSRFALGLLITAIVTGQGSAQQTATKTSSRDSTVAKTAATSTGAETPLTIAVQEIDAPVIAPVRRRSSLQSALVADTQSAATGDLAPITEQADVPGPSGSDSIRVERDGWSIAVHIPSTEPVSLSEPVHVNGRIRLYVSLPAGPLELAEGVNTGPAARLLNLAAEQDDLGAARLVVDVSQLAGYRIDRNADSSTLWVDTEPATVTTEAAATTGSISAVLQMLNRVPRRAALATMVGLLFAATFIWRFTARHGRRETDTTDTSSQSSRTRKSKRTTAVAEDRAGNSATTSSPDHSAEAAIWVARTLAGSGFDASAIARRTGLPRDAATLLVNGARRTLPPSAGSSVWSTGPTVFATIPIEAII